MLRMTSMSGGSASSLDSRRRRVARSSRQGSRQNVRCGWGSTVADEIVVSGGGVTAVAVDELFGHAQALEAVSAEASSSARLLVGIDVLVSPGPADVSALAAERAIATALAALAELERGAGSTARALRLAAEGYGLAERASEAASRRAAATLGYAAGFFLPVLAFLAVPVATNVMLPVLLGAAVSPGGLDALRAAASRWFDDHRGVLMNPAVVDAIRHSVSSSDDVAAGAVRLPPWVANLLGDAGLGVTGVASSAVAISVVGSRFGIFAETPVRVTATSTTTGRTAPSSLAERVDRIPRPEGATGEQIIIDRIESPGRTDRFEVYLAGTVDFTPVARDEVFDMTSNMAGVGELPSGSYRAVEQALADAGVTASSSVVFTGHSQGGLIATALAASGDYATAGVVTIGAPSGHLEVPSHIPVIAIEHTDDLVPALAGVRTDHAAILVERRAYEPGQVLPESPLAAHERAPYRETAAMADRASDARLAEAVRAIARNTEGAERVTTTTYYAERITRDD